MKIYKNLDFTNNGYRKRLNRKNYNDKTFIQYFLDKKYIPCVILSEYWFSELNKNEANINSFIKKINIKHPKINVLIVQDMFCYKNNVRRFIIKNKNDKNISECLLYMVKISRLNKFLSRRSIEYNICFIKCKDWYQSVNREFCPY